MDARRPGRLSRLALIVSAAVVVVVMIQVATRVCHDESTEYTGSTETSPSRHASEPADPAATTESVAKGGEGDPWEVGADPRTLASVVFHPATAHEERVKAARRLAATGEAAVPHLLPRLLSDENAAWAAEVLADIGHPAVAAVPELLRLLRERKAVGVVRHALISIGGERVEEGVASLIETPEQDVLLDIVYIATRLEKLSADLRRRVLRLASDRDPRLRAEALRAAADFGPPSPRDLDILKSGCGDPDVDVRSAAFAALGRAAAADAAALSVLVAQLRGERYDQREIAGNTLRALGPDAAPATTELVRAAAGAQPRVVTAIAEALVAIGEDAVNAALAGGDEQLAVIVVRALASSGERSTWRSERLSRTLATGGPPFVRAAIEGVLQSPEQNLADLTTRPEFEGVLVGWLVEGDAETRALAARAAGAAGNAVSEDLAILVTARVMDSEAPVRRSALAAVRRFGAEARRAAVPLLDAMWSDARLSEVDRIRVAGTLGAIDPTRVEVLAWLAEQFVSCESETWRAALGELRAIGTPSAARVLARATDRAGSLPRRAALSALGGFREIDGAAWLAIERALASSDAMTRRAAALAANRSGVRPARVTAALRRLLDDHDPDVKRAVEQALRDSAPARPDVREALRVPKHATDADLKRLLARNVGIRSLSLESCASITDAGLAHVADLSNLASLDLSGCERITDVGLAHLASLERLRSLRISFADGLTAGGLEQVARLKSLRALRISACDGVTDEGLKLLASLTELESLELDLLDNITDKGLRPLRRLQRLEILSLGDCERLTGAALETVVELPALTSLNLVGLRRIRPRQVAHLKRLKNLTDLALDDSGITDDGLRQIGELARLEFLGLRGAEVTQTAVAALRRGLPDCEIEWDEE